MHFLSDNTAAVHPRIMEAMMQANVGHAPSYGADGLTLEAEQLLEEVFDTDVRVFLVASGTAANALALSAMTPPFGGILCHEEAHINTDECGAPEFFTGAKLIPLPGEHGKLTPQTVERRLAAFAHGEHQVKPAVLSISNPTEWGVLYTPDEVRALAEVAHAHGMLLHVDGARFANAVAALSCHPDDLAGRAGVDALSLGATKNGAMMAEAVLFFRTALAEEFPRRRKRAGQLLSKSRYPAAQMIAWLRDDLWLELALHANAMARLLAARLDDFADVDIAVPVETNMVFARLPRKLHEALMEEGAEYYCWREEGGEVLARLVCSWQTREEDIESFVTAMERHAPRGGGA